MNNGLHALEAIKYTPEHDLACSLCSLRIPTKKTSRNTETLLEWQAYEVMGAFCSEKCAQIASSDNEYRALYTFTKGA